MEATILGIMVSILAPKMLNKTLEAIEKDVNKAAELGKSGSWAGRHQKYGVIMYYRDSNELPPI